MKFLKKYGGLLLMSLGVLMLIGLHLTHLTTVNALLLLSVFLIIAGIVLQLWTTKRESRY